MAFKMSRPSMIDISYNKEKNSVSPLHKETNGKKNAPTSKPSEPSKPTPSKSDPRQYVETVNEMPFGALVTDTATTSTPPKDTPPTPPKDTPPKDTQKSKPSGADALKAAKQARLEKKYQKKSQKKKKRLSIKDARKQDRADKIMSKL